MATSQKETVYTRPIISDEDQKFVPEHHEKTFGSKAAFSNWLHKHAVYEIHFEDRHQDFLVWTLDTGGEVIDCQPFQGSVWCGTIVDLSSLFIGEQPRVQNRNDIGNLRQLNYRVEKIYRLQQPIR